jgi:ABC-type transport system involved in multi-copper enzyme maturation permease subunit
VSELFDRKIIYLYAFATLMAFFVVFAGDRLEVEFGTQTGQSLDSGEMDGFVSSWVAEGLSVFMSLLVFMTAMAVAGLIPGMFRKGRAEFYLPSPIARGRLLLTKVFSIWTIYGVFAIACGLLTFAFAAIILPGVSTRMLILFGVYYLDVLIWVSVIVFGGVLFKSASGAIITAFFVWLLQRAQGILDWINELINTPLISWAQTVLYYAIPDTSALGDIAIRLGVGGRITSWMPLWHSLLFAVVLLYLATWVFKRRDF